MLSLDHNSYSRRLSRRKCTGSISTITIGGCSVFIIDSDCSSVIAARSGAITAWETCILTT